MQNLLPIGPLGSSGDVEGVAKVPGAREQLTYLVHDMQSAVTSVSLMVELLEIDARAGDDPTQRARAISALNSCLRMASLCTETASLLNGTTGRDPAPREFDLLELLVEAMTVYSPIYDLVGKKLELNTKCRFPKFFGIRSQLFRAVSNLLDNGLKHTSYNSTVLVVCADTDEDVSVSISDNGPGMEGLASGTVQPIGSLPVVLECSSDISVPLPPGTGLKFVSEIVAFNGGSSTIERNSLGGTTVTLKFLKH